MKYILGIFAVANLTDIFFYDKIMQPFRLWLGIIEDIGGNRVHYIKPNGVLGFVHDVLKCYKCTTVWIAGLIMFIYILPTKLYKIVTMLLMFSWLAAFMDRALGKLGL